MTRLLLPFVLILSALAVPKAWALDALVIDVHDGDSITVAGVPGHIRIRNMDAPELKAFKWGYQPYAAESRTSLLNLCGGQIATLTNIKPDIYKTRLDANVSCQGFDVTKWQIDTGNAWGYHYAPKKYKRMALAAKEKGLGLWALPNPTDPYYWRKLGMH